jgi:hypothetical protein
MDRRRARRRSEPDEHGIVATRIRPGHDAEVVDVSAAGALIHTRYRLLPGARIALHVETADRRALVRGRVLRCSVVGLLANYVWYCGAIQFDECLPWFEADASRYETRIARGISDVRPHEL